MLPFVTVIIPVRNEERYIGGCLHSILAGPYPVERLEILVVDGHSDDRTREIVQSFSARHPSVRLLANPARVVPHAMNIGIRAAGGEIIVRMDAHACYEPQYVLQLVTWMERLNADNVGGVCVTRSASEAAEARAVALLLSHPFGVGNSQFRLAVASSPIEVDTVPFGCYRRETFGRIGMYDEMFIRNQDDELNARLKKFGGRIFLIPEIKIDYIARDSVRKLARMMYQYGYFKPLIAVKLGRPATARQLAPPLFTSLFIGLLPASLIVPGALYLWVVVAASHAMATIAVSTVLARRHGWPLLLYLIGGFVSGHLSYGIGYLKGVLDFGILRRHVKESGCDVPMSR